MERVIIKELGITPEKIEGSGGVFDVAVNDEVIFSKHKAGRFPTDAEIIELIKGK